MKKRYWHAYADAQGESHVEELETELILSDFAPPAPQIFVSPATPAAGFAYLHAPVGWDGGWHPSPRRQLFILLRGGLEGETSDGQKIKMQSGDVILLEDTFGRGHASRVIGSDAVEALVVALPQ